MPVQIWRVAPFFVWPVSLDFLFSGFLYISWFDAIFVYYWFNSWKDANSAPRRARASATLTLLMSSLWWSILRTAFTCHFLTSGTHATPLVCNHFFKNFLTRVQSLPSTKKKLLITTSFPTRTFPRRTPSLKQPNHLTVSLSSLDQSAYSSSLCVIRFEGIHSIVNSFRPLLFSLGARLSLARMVETEPTYETTRMEAFH